MRKLLAIFMTLTLITACFVGCDDTEADDNGKLSIISTIFPGYDFSNQICGTNAEITMLLPPGAESHSYEPSPRDIIKIQKCDLFIYVGGYSDSWVDKILGSMDKPVKTIKMMDCVNVVEEEFIEGMMDEDEDDGVEYDEHVWTSPKNAVKIAEAISQAICEIDKPNSGLYEKNTADYVKKLIRLDEDFSDFFASVQNKTLIFGDRFPFRYFVDAYGLSYYAAFPGCSSETEASAATIAFLIDKVKSDDISTIFYIDFSNHKIADSIAEATGTKTAMLRVCHSVTKEDLEKGANYISLMEQNLTTLKESMKQAG